MNLWMSQLKVVMSCPCMVLLKISFIACKRSYILSSHLMVSKRQKILKAVIFFMNQWLIIWIEFLDRMFGCVFAKKNKFSTIVFFHYNFMFCFHLSMIRKFIFRINYLIGLIGSQTLLDLVVMLG